MLDMFTTFAACSRPGFFSLPTWYKYLEVEPKTVGSTGQEICEVQFSLMDGGKFNGTDVLLVALGVVDILIRIAALVAVGFVIYGGFRYMTSQGSPDGTKAAQSTIINALVGLVVAILAAAIVSFIGYSIGG
ncbi:MAG TPA: pilin [Candidatus Saccharimonadales bacterium]|nr:pilin [Candidatus Saccharimonadales bacterium]